MKHFNNKYNEEIFEILKTYKKRFSSVMFSKKHRRGKIFGRSNQKVLTDYIFDRTKDILPKNVSFLIRVLFVLNKWTDYPRCIQCGKPLKKFIHVKKFRLKIVDGKLEIPKFCSSKCSMSNKKVQQKIAKALSEKFGRKVSNAF